MSLAAGFIWMSVVVVLGSIGLVLFAIWIRIHDTERESHNTHDDVVQGVKHA